VAVKGLLATIFLFFSFTCHDSYMHSWGSIFIQDIYMPITNKALDPAHHITLLRRSIIGVAIFAFFFSLFYQPTEKIFFFFAITGTIWLGGSGAVIIGGLYWRRGTTPGAYCALITGAVTGLLGLIIPKVYLARTGHEFPINGQWLWLIGMLSASLIYFFVSLATTSKVGVYNLERVLHRGRYRVAEDHVLEHTQSKWQQLVGITKEFSKADKVLAIALVTWNAAWFLFFVVFSVINLLRPVGDSVWIQYHFINVIALPLIISVPVTIWFLVGGIVDLKALFRSLATATRDASDDGRFHGYKDEAPIELSSTDEPVAVTSGNEGDENDKK
jgi:SSS family solute:Na+ symporter